MDFINVDDLSSKEFQALDERVKELKAEGALPLPQMDRETHVAYIVVDGLNYPIEAMLDRDAREVSLRAASKISVMRGRLLIVPIVETTKRSKAGIVLVTAFTQAPRRGTVVGVGEDTIIKKKKVTSPCKIGDTVVYVGGDHQEVKVNNHKYMIVPFEDVLVKLVA